MTEPARNCIVPECQKDRRRKGLCDAHYTRQYRGKESADLLRFRSKKTTSLEEHKKRIMENVDVDSATGCWNWTGGLSYHGYGNAKGIVDGQPYYNSHRLAYAVFVGPIPKYESVHHTCSNTTCCNPEHLQPVSVRENIAEWRLRKAYEQKIAQLQELLSNCTCRKETA